MGNPFRSAHRLPFTLPALAQKNTAGKEDPAKKTQTVEVSCSKMQIRITRQDMRLAVRMGENAYYVSGASIDDFGDAHAHDSSAMPSARVKRKENW